MMNLFIETGISHKLLGSLFGIRISAAKTGSKLRTADKIMRLLDYLTKNMINLIKMPLGCVCLLRQSFVLFYKAGNKEHI
jgi:hypothetical protein